MTSVPVKQIRVLVDLKPALDGFAGIPQETRLLFRGLSAIPDIAVDGLIQHGGKNIRAGLRRGDQSLSPDARFNRLSRVVVSIFARPYPGKFGKIYQAVERALSSFCLGLLAKLGFSVALSEFDPRNFEDFIWRTFFSKTLSSADFAVVTCARFKIVERSRLVFHKSGLGFAADFLGRRYPELNTRGYSALIAQTPFPGRVSSDTTLIVRYHDAVPVLMPHTISDSSFHQATHYHALKENVRSGAWFACISEAARRDLVSIFPDAESRSVVIHNVVSNAYFRDVCSDAAVTEILSTRRRRAAASVDSQAFPILAHGGVAPLRYLLMVSTLEPRKNHEVLLEAWERLRVSGYPDVKLVLVGSLGWDVSNLLKRISPWIDRGDLFWLSDVPTGELRSLYSNAVATVCPGYFEGFDYSGIEAMKCGCSVVASDIAVHREIYGNAALYFNPYDVADVVGSISRVIGAEATALRASLASAGAEVSARYSFEVILPQWESFFSRVFGSIVSEGVPGGS